MISRTVLSFVLAALTLVFVLGVIVLLVRVSRGKHDAPEPESDSERARELESPPAGRSAPAQLEYHKEPVSAAEPSPEHGTTQPGGRVIPVIAVLFVLLASTYALRTPIWQSPDEPAHFNYVRDIGEGRGLPILTVSDWDAQYLNRLKALKFPAGFSIDSIRYESHQPPLYYALVSPIYLLARGLPLGLQALTLRLISILFVAAAIVLSHFAVRELFPENRLLQLGVPSLIALVPQHVSIAASVNNDGLAELVMAAILLAALRTIRLADRPDGLGTVSTARGVWLGALLGIALLTKTTIYLALGIIPLAVLAANRPLVEAALARRWTDLWRLGRPTIRTVALVYLVALAISGWWFVRNVTVYGGFDLFGWYRHDQVVVGQLLATDFWEEFPTFARVTFQSFWAQLGWMGVPASPETYFVLAVLSAAALAGAVGFWRRTWATSPYAVKAGMTVLLTALVLVFLEVVQYNLRYLQPQGRYLFPAIAPIALLLVAGVAEIVMIRPQGLGSSIVLVSSAALLALVARALVQPTSSPLLFGMLLLPAGAAVLLAAASISIPTRLRSLSAFGVGFTLAAVFALDVLALVTLLPYLYHS